MNGNSPRGRLRQQIMLALAAMGAALVVGEIAVRNLSPSGHVTPDTLRRESLQYQPAVFARHVLPQMTQAPTETGPARINARGYRGPDFAVPKPKGTRRIVILGGSAVYDWHAAEGQDWPRLVEKGLRARGFANVEVINAGVPGHASCDSLGRFYTEIWMFEPDVVVVCHAWNDIKYFRDVAPDHSLLRTIEPPPAVRQAGQLRVANPYIYYTGRFDRLFCHSQLYVRLRNRYWSWRLGRIGFEGIVTGRVCEPDAKPNTRRPAAGAPPPPPPPPARYDEWGPRQFELNLRLLVNAIRSVPAVPVLLTQPRLVAAGNGPGQKARIRYEYVNLTHDELVRAFADCDRAVLAVAKSENAPALDLSSRLTGRDELFGDQVHTTEAGSRAIADELTAFLAEILARQ